jgi:hypothetical protein
VSAPVAYQFNLPTRFGSKHHLWRIQSMKRSTAHIGDIHPAGTITAIHPPRGKNRSVRVEFKCSTCSSLSEPSRYSDLKRGKTKSCGCLSKKTFYNHHMGKLDKLSPAERKLHKRNRQRHPGSCTSCHRRKASERAGLPARVCSPALCTESRCSQREQ